LRIQQRIKNAELGISVEEPLGELPDFPSFIPFLPPLVSVHTIFSMNTNHNRSFFAHFLCSVLNANLEAVDDLSFTCCKQSAANLRVYYATCFTLIAGIMVFGGFLAPIVSYILICGIIQQF
jgi:hypothetical protein